MPVDLDDQDQCAACGIGAGDGRAPGDCDCERDRLDALRETSERLAELEMVLWHFEDFDDAAAVRRTRRKINKLRAQLRALKGES